VVEAGTRQGSPSPTLSPEEAIKAKKKADRIARMKARDAEAGILRALDPGEAALPTVGKFELEQGSTDADRAAVHLASQHNAVAKVGLGEANPPDTAQPASLEKACIGPLVDVAKPCAPSPLTTVQSRLAAKLAAGKGRKPAPPPPAGFFMAPERVVM